MDKKFYITTSIAYANAQPHIGHAYEAVLADIIARYKSMRGVSTFFLTGMDEHGDKIVRASQKANMAPQVFVDMNAGKFKELFKKFNISYDYFVRTSDKEHHWQGAQALWKKISDAKDIYKGVYKGLYCVGCEAFITEKELVDGKCSHHDVAPERIEEENYFFRLSKYTEKLKEKITSGELDIIPLSRKNETLAFLENGLEDISFSRPEGAIPWGVPVPVVHGHMMYVWCDALSNYITGLGFGRKDDENFKKFWPADVHVIGKDITRFHAIIWPAMLLSAGLPLPKKILAHGFITSSGKKMSKSLGNTIDPMEFESKYSAECLRYFFAREITPFEDGDFTEERFIETYNANLANGLGNLVSRTIKMSGQYFDGKVSRGADTDVPLKREFVVIGDEAKIEGYSISYLIQSKFLPDYYERMDSFEINNAVDVVWQLIGILDGYVTSHEPFKLIKEDKQKTENIIWNLLLGLQNVSYMLAPVMPDTAKKIKEVLGIEFDNDGVPVSFNTKPLDAPLFLRK